MHFLSCKKLDFQVVETESEDTGVFRIERAKHWRKRREQDRHGPCLMGTRELLPEGGGASRESTCLRFFFVSYFILPSSMD